MRSSLFWDYNLDLSGSGSKNIKPISVAVADKIKNSDYIKGDIQNRGEYFKTSKFQKIMLTIRLC